MKNLTFTIIALLSVQLFAIDSTYVSFAGSTEANGYYAAIDTISQFGNLSPVFSNGTCEIRLYQEDPEGKDENSISFWQVKYNGTILYEAGEDETNCDEEPIIDDYEIRSGIDPEPVVYFGEYLQYSYLIFNETSTETGQFDVSDPLIIKHNNFKNRAFTGIDGEDFYQTGKVSFTNIPTGITPEVIRIDSLTLSIALTGEADNHDNINDAYIPIGFHDSAFTSSDSAAVYFAKINCYLNFRQEYFVAPSGGDFTSIRDAYNAGDINFGGGDVIYVAPGTYNETKIFFRKNTDIIGSGVGNTIMQYDLSGSSTDYLFEVLRDTLNLSNIHLRYGSITATENDGGAINIARDAIVNLDNVLITDSKGNNGGAIYSDGMLSIYNSTIKDCEANYGGGGIYNEYNGSLEIVNSTISNNNTLTWDGGGILNRSELVLINSTIAFNDSARFGGGIYNCYGSNCSVDNSTIYGNTSTALGGGLYTNGGTINIINSIITENYSDTIHSDYHVAYSVTLNDYGYNCIGYQSIEGTPDNWYFSNPTNILFNMKVDSTTSSEWTRDNIVLTNQTLGLDSVLTDNFTKNSTQTIAVLNGSFLIDAGTDQSVGDFIVPELDQRGWDRYGMVDIGAYEHGTSSVPRNANVISDGLNSTIIWDSVEGALSYRIYASLKPYSDFQDLTDFGEFNYETSWTVPYAGQKMFFYVVSSPSDRKSNPIQNVTDEMILEYLRK